MQIMPEKNKKKEQLGIEPLLVGTKETAQLLGIGVTTFYHLCSSGRIGPMALKFGKRSLFRIDELREWVKADCPSRDRWQAMKKTRRD
jgi:excisionase family DNA binding protein